MNLTTAAATITAGALLLAALAAPAPATAVTSPVLSDTAATCTAVARNPQGVLVIGDSITAAGFSSIKANLARLGRPSCINARSGRGTAEGVEVLRTYIRSGQIPLTIIMALGTNDTLIASTIPAQAKATMFAVGQGRRVYWVNIYNAQTDRSAEALAQTRAINYSLAVADRATVNLAVVDWYSYVAPRASYLMQLDGVHPTWPGNQCRTTVMLNGVLTLWTRP
jgi:lysophospholipase L1-like esterase